MCQLHQQMLYEKKVAGTNAEDRTENNHRGRTYPFANAHSDEINWVFATDLFGLPLAVITGIAIPKQLES